MPFYTYACEICQVEGEWHGVEMGCCGVIFYWECIEDWWSNQEPTCPSCETLTEFPFPVSWIINPCWEYVGIPVSTSYPASPASHVSGTSDVVVIDLTGDSDHSDSPSSVSGSLDEIESISSGEFVVSSDTEDFVDVEGLD